MDGSVTIPLNCNICPKKPVFSDVSHLLTHVASKGHLSHYFKLKVRANSDIEARNLVEEYDQWYAEWNVEDLMSERMSLKDKKRPRVKIGGTRTSTSTSAPIARTSGALSRRTSTSRSVPSVNPSPSISAFDPRLLDNHVKLEQNTPPLQTLGLPSLPSASLSTLSLGSIPVAYRSTYGRTTYFPQRHDSPFHRGAYLATTTSGYVDSTRQNSYADLITVGSASPVKTPGSSQLLEEENELPKQAESTSDHAKLKGVLWPGMSIFDSATPIARRRRNQKKDANILEQLENNSRDVEPTELVWTPGGNLKKQKDISGLPSSSSPIMSPLLVGTALRRPLADVRSKEPWTDVDTLGYSTYGDEKLEQSLTYGAYDDVDPKRSHQFQVWHDDSTNTSKTVHFGPPPSHFPYLARSLQGQSVKKKNATATVRRRNRSQLSTSDMKKRPPTSTLERAVSQNRLQSRVSIHRRGLDNDFALAHPSGFDSLLAAAEDASTNRQVANDPFILEQQHRTGFDSLYHPSGQLATGNSNGTLQAPTQIRHHHRSLSIENLLVGGCPTTSTEARQESVVATDHHGVHQFGFSTHANFGFGVPMASPAHPHTSSANVWSNFWSGVNHGPSDHGFWSGHGMEDYHDAGGLSKLDEEEETVSVRNLPVDLKARLAAADAVEREEEHRDTKMALNDCDNAKIEDDDDGRTVSAPLTPNK